MAVDVRGYGRRLKEKLKGKPKEAKPGGNAKTREKLAIGKARKERVERVKELKKEPFLTKFGKKEEIPAKPAPVSAPAGRAVEPRRGMLGVPHVAGRKEQKKDIKRALKQKSGELARLKRDLKALHYENKAEVNELKSRIIQAKTDLQELKQRRKLL